MSLVNNYIPYFIQDQFERLQDQGQVWAYTMFIDLSGFTTLTETFMQQGNEGAEALSNTLNSIFSPMVEIVYQKGGFIPYFAGDAINAIFPTEQAADDLDNFLATALEIRNLFVQQEIRKTAFGDFEIGAKIGLSCGDVSWGIVGAKNKSFYFRGEPIDNSADCQSVAQKGDIIFDENFKLKLANKPVHFHQLKNHPFYQLLTFDNISFAKSEIKKVPSLNKKVVKHFIPKSVLAFNEVGEFRSVISIFISFDQVDSHDLLNEFASIVLKQVNNFSGYFKEIDFGDKGGVIVCFIGAPVSFENNIERALELVSAIKDDTIQLEAKGLRYKIGITSGTAFAGLIGGKERLQYAVVGNHVNLSARLMTSAEWGEILVDEDIQKHKQFSFTHTGDIHYKGIKKDIPTYRLEGRNNEDISFFSGKMYGREEQLHTLSDFSKKLYDQNNSPGVAFVYGEAGIGKSRLIFELKRQINTAADIQWLTCQADQILRKPFNPFVYLLKYFFNHSPENTFKNNLANFDEKFNQLVTKVESAEHAQSEKIVTELNRTKSILAALIGLRIENSLWEQLDAKGRYQNTLATLDNFLMANAVEKPLVVELEDGHWYDDNSKDFLKDFIRRLNRFPILIIVTSRYLLDDGSKPVLIPSERFENNNIKTIELDLNTLSDQALTVFAEAQLMGKISPEFKALLLRTTNGNPFYLEQIIEYFIESDLLTQQNKIYSIKDKEVKLSNSINAILMARVDRLSSLVKDTVKAAAVIGREFEVPILSEVMKVQESFIDKNGDAAIVLKEQIKTAEKGQIWQAMNELRYIFKHSLLREAVYDMQLNTRLRKLHLLIGNAIENLYSDNIENRYADLVFHFEQAEVVDKTVFYLHKAAEYTRNNFQNKRSLKYYDKLLAYLKFDDNSEEEINVLLRKGELLELTGEWDKCEVAYSHAHELATALKNSILETQCQNHLGKLLMLKGDYEKAQAYLNEAIGGFEEVNDSNGIASVYGNLGNLFFRQGKYDEAKQYFENSISISKKTNQRINAQIVSNLGLTHMNQSDYLEGIDCQKEQLAICKKNNDQQGMATLYTNMGIVYYEKGDYEEALASYEKGLELSRELGNKLLTAIAIGCIGSVYQRQGDYTKAMDNFEKDLVLCEELGDKQGIAIAHGLMGDLLSTMGILEDASFHLERQLQLSKELNYKKGIAKALNSLGDVYTFQDNYDKAILYYDEAISVTRSIDNKLVLSNCLVEKADVLLQQGKIETAKELQKEAVIIAHQLGNPPLIFIAETLAARIAIADNDYNKARTILQNLQELAKETPQHAALLYEHSKINPSYLPKALKAYKDLYEQTPKFLYKLRIDKLESQASS